MERISKINLTTGLFLVSAVVCIAGCSSGQSRLGPVIEPEELSRRLDERSGTLVVLDVRDAAAYEQGHVAGAIRVDSATWKSESLAAETGLDHASYWRGRIGELGISGREPVVIYDDGRMTEAARIWFIFQHFGLPEAAVLNGGYPALAQMIGDGRVRMSQDSVDPVPVEFEPRDTRESRIALIERQQVRSAVEKNEAQVFDARTHEEYVGEELRENTRGGHIPTAINLPHKQLLDEQNRLKSPKELAALFEQAGFKRGQPVITHCDGGGRASLAALAAARAGYGPVLNYYLSYGDWAADATCPVMRPGE